MGENIVSMGNNTQQEKKLSYEELQDAASKISANYNNLLERHRELVAKYQDAIQNQYFARLEWLWRIINKAELFEEEFVHKCATEFMEIMMPSEQPEEVKE